MKLSPPVMMMDPLLTPLHQRLREVGAVALRCDLEGEPTWRPPRGRDWLSDLLGHSAMVDRALTAAAARWCGQENPSPVQGLSGLWLAPTPVVNRRHRQGYVVAVIPSERLLQEADLEAMCQCARLDLTITRRMLDSLPLFPSPEIPRLATLCRFLYEDHSRLTNEGSAMESIGQQLAESYEEINLLYTIIQSMTVRERPEHFVRIACEELLGTLPYGCIAAQFADDSSRLKSLSTRLISAGHPADQPRLDREFTQRLLEMTQPDAPMVLMPGSNPKHAEFGALGDPVLVHPVSSDEQVMGILIAANKLGNDTAVSSADMKLLGATASHMSIFLENAALYEDLNAMFLGTLEALTASIDAKDRYTCGHSRRVAELSAQLARAVGLDQRTVERVHIAGLVHDVGKIGVPEHVLTKPGRLNEDEFGWIKKHPEIGYLILKDIPQLEDVLPGVLYHHERWDGRGYPHGLEGDEIPLVARLIALADSFDAMSSNRTYRRAMSRQDVLGEIDHCAGIQFDPRLARIFIALDFNDYDRQVALDQSADSSFSAAQWTVPNPREVRAQLTALRPEGEAA